VSHVEDITQIYAFFDEPFFKIKTHVFFGGVRAQVSKGRGLLVLGLGVGEQILDQSQENGLIVSNDLGDVEISQGSFQQRILLDL